MIKIKTALGSDKHQIILLFKFFKLKQFILFHVKLIIYQMNLNE